MATPEPKSIIIIGGGIIGCATAYHLTHHASYSPTTHSVTVLEATALAAGASGKAGGFIARWATPACLAPLSFDLHRQLADEHDGKRRWGYRGVCAAEVRLWARDLGASATGVALGEADGRGEVAAMDDGAARPDALDWLAPGALRSYEEIGTPADSAQVQPYLLTTALASLAQERGAKVLIGAATAINYTADGQRVASVSYTTPAGAAQTLAATDVVVAAGPWTPTLLPAVQLRAPRGHSVVVRPTRPLSSHILFPEISAAPDSGLGEVISPDIYPRPPDARAAHDNAYASGPDDHAAALPARADGVAVDPARIEAVEAALGGVSRALRDGEVLARQACHKPQIREHEEGEAVGPMVGGLGVRGLWLATGHDEWGVQNAPGTGRVVSEMVLEGRARSADVQGLEPWRWMGGGEG